MELGTAGAILSYGLELEAKAAEYYETHLDRELSSETKDVLDGLIRNHRKVMKRLDRVRKEQVTEMILEPIRDFESDDFVIETEVGGNNTTNFKSIEKTILEYFRASAQKVAFLPEMKQILEDLAERIEMNCDALARL